MTELFELTVAEAASVIRRREISCVDLMEALLSRSSALDPELRVWVTLDADAALDEARRSQQELESSGARGPLHGVPVGIKDIYLTEGVRTTAGSPIYADFVPAYDATTVALLKQAGAIVMGKTVTTEFACMDPSPTRNPWDPAHTPGGSSSGSAAGVAARMFPAALGSQTAGSVLRPASYNGIIGTKPSFGRVSRYGVFPVAWSLDTMGWFTRSVEDAAILLSVMAGHDPRDHSSSTKPTPDYVQAARRVSPPPRVGVLHQLFEDRADAEVRANAKAAVEQLAAAGAAVEHVSVPTNFETLLAAHITIMKVEASAVHEADFRARPDDYAPKVRALIESGTVIPAVSYVQAQRVRRRFRREMEEAIRDFDVLLTPSTPEPAPRDLTTTGDAVFQVPWTTCGFPSITLPSGLSAAGLPLGIQLAAAPYDEETLLSSASWCEQALGVSLENPMDAAQR